MNNEKAIKVQEDFNEALIEMMCVTFSKKQMKQLLKAYIKSNKLTEDILALKDDLNKSNIQKKEHLDRLNKIRTEYKNLKNK